MARKPAPESTRKLKASPADQAFGAAASFINSLGTLARCARQLTDPNQIKPSADDPDQWKPLGATYAEAFLAWFDLSHLLTVAVRGAARRVYPPGAPAFKLGKLKPTSTVIEAIADELGVFFRNVLYQSRRCPLDPDTERVVQEAKAQATARQIAQGKPATPLGWSNDFNDLMKLETCAAVRARLGIKTECDGWMLFVREWENQDPARVRSNLELLRCGSIDFDDLKTQLDREAQAVLASAADTPAQLIRKLSAARIGIDWLCKFLTEPRGIIGTVIGGLILASILAYLARQATPRAAPQHSPPAATAPATSAPESRSD